MRYITAFLMMAFVISYLAGCSIVDTEEANKSDVRITELYYEVIPEDPEDVNLEGIEFYMTIKNLGSSPGEVVSWEGWGGRRGRWVLLPGEEKRVRFDGRDDFWLYREIEEYCEQIWQKSVILTMVVREVSNGTYYIVYTKIPEDMALPPAPVWQPDTPAPEVVSVSIKEGQVITGDTTITVTFSMEMTALFGNSWTYLGIPMLENIP